MKRNYLLWISLAGNVLAILAVLYASNRLGGMQNVIYRIKNPEVISNQSHRKSVLEMLEIDSTTNVMLGNSLTAYCEWAELMEEPRFVNRGIPGESLAGIEKRLPDLLLQNPGRIFLMIGINDLMYHDAQWVIAAYESLIQSVLQQFPGAPLVLQEILPVHQHVQNIPTDNEQIKSVNKAIEGLAKKYNLKFLPLFDRFIDQSDQLASHFSNDGVHLTGEAYMIWKNALRQFLNNTPE